MKIWEFTDDIVIAAIMATWIYSKVTGNCVVEDSYMTLALGYVFGNTIGTQIGSKLVAEDRKQPHRMG